MSLFRQSRKGLTFRTKKKIITPELIRDILSCVFFCGVAVFFAFALVTAFGTRIRAVGDSMSPTVSSGERVLVDSLIYKLSRPSRGDIVVFRPGGNEKTHYYIKRVAAVPGDTVQIVDGVLMVNGLPSSAITSIFGDPGIAALPVTLETGTYFVVGDNPDSGEDSRSANIGPVELSHIYGKAWFKLGDNSGFLR